MKDAGQARLHVQSGGTGVQSQGNWSATASGGMADHKGFICGHRYSDSQQDRIHKADREPTDSYVLYCERNRYVIDHLSLGRCEDRWFVQDQDRVPQRDSNHWIRTEGHTLSVGQGIYEAAVRRRVGAIACTDEDGVSPVGLNLFAIRFAFVRGFCSQSDPKKPVWILFHVYWWRTSKRKTLKETFKTMFNGVSTDLNWSFMKRL